jgi:hypothetical protein
MFAKRKRRKLAERHLDEAIAAEWAARGVIPSGPGPQPFREALREAGLPNVGESDYSVIAVEVVKSAVASLSDEDRALVSSRSAPQPQEEPSEPHSAPQPQEQPTEPAVDLSDFPLMREMFGEDALRDLTVSMQEERDRRTAIEEEVQRQIMRELPDRRDEWPAELERRMTRIWEQENAIASESEEELRGRLEWAMPTATTFVVRTSDGEEGEVLFDRGSTDDERWWVLLNSESVPRLMPRDSLTMVAQKVTWDERRNSRLSGRGGRRPPRVPPLPCRGEGEEYLHLPRRVGPSATRPRARQRAMPPPPAGSGSNPNRRRG